MQSPLSSLFYKTESFLGSSHEGWFRVLKFERTFPVLENLQVRDIYFLFLKMNITSGGHLAQMRLLETARRITPAHAVVYESRDDNVSFLDEVFQQADATNSIFVIHWGFHVPDLIHRLKDMNVLYLSYSTGYGFNIPARVRIIAGSRHTLAYWSKHAPDSTLYYLPAIISDEFTNLHQNRDITFSNVGERSYHLPGSAQMIVSDLDSNGKRNGSACIRPRPHLSGLPDRRWMKLPPVRYMKPLRLFMFYQTSYPARAGVDLAGQ